MSSAVGFTQSARAESEDPIQYHIGACSYTYHPRDKDM